MVFVCSGNIRDVSSIHLRPYRTVFCCVAEISRTVQSPSEVRMDKRRKERMNVFREYCDSVQSVVYFCCDNVENSTNDSKSF